MSDDTLRPEWWTELTLPPDTAMEIMQPNVVCPKHGTHPYTLVSTIPGHEGRWCQICWIESMGPPLEVVDRPYSAK